MIVSPAGALQALDLWDAGSAAAVATSLGVALPPPGRAETGAAGTAMRIGPRRWWLDGAGFTLVPALGDFGVVTPVAGGVVRVQVSGARWRDLVMASGLIDAEDQAFGPGSVAVTALCHARCVLHVRAVSVCDVLVPASYADHCLSAWRAMGWNQVGR